MLGKMLPVLIYYALTGVTFYLVAYDVMFHVPALGPFPAPFVKAVIFVSLHILVHQMKKVLK
jgi:hypothetical protein